MAPPVEKSPEAFRTISEVADWLGVPAHVLRFWESKFPQVKPVKRAGGRRYFRPADMRLLGGIRVLLHEDGMTIKAVQKKLSEEGVAGVADLSPPHGAADSPADPRPRAGMCNGDGADTTPQGIPADSVDTAPEAKTDLHEEGPAPDPDADLAALAPDDPDEIASHDDTAQGETAAPSDDPVVDAAEADDAPSEAHAAPETAEPEAPSAPPAAPALPPLPDMPDDPPDDMQTDAGPLSRLAALAHPVSRARAEQLSTLAARLRQTGEREA